MTTIQWFDATGRKEALQAKPGFYVRPHLSPDGKRLATSITEGSKQDVWVYDQQRDAMTRLTSGRAIYTGAVWSPDGRYVFIGSVGSGILWTRADGSGQPQTLIQSKGIVVPWSVTQDGKRLAYFETLGPAQIWTVPLQESND
jgi:Tol biopolymer transport system component